MLLINTISKIVMLDRKLITLDEESVKQEAGKLGAEDPRVQKQ